MADLEMATENNRSKMKELMDKASAEAEKNSAMSARPQTSMVPTPGVDYTAAPVSAHAAAATAKQLTDTRHGTHGDWKVQSAITRQIKSVIANHDDRLTASRREALDMIAVKMGRIMAGDASFPDHWDDIMGYAKLGKEGHG